MADLVAGGPCELCRVTEARRWWCAQPPVAGCAVLCDACHRRARAALERLLEAARRCPVAVVEALAERLEVGAAALPAPASTPPPADV